MKVTTDGYSHFKQIEICGDLNDSGNGIQLNPSASGSGVNLTAVGDDTNVSISVVPKGSGTVNIPSGGSFGVATLTDSGGVNRFIPNPTAKAITDSAAYSLFTAAAASAAGAAGAVHYSVFASNGTDHQMQSGMVLYASVNKAGTITAVVTEDTVAANICLAASSGTLTLAWTVTSDSVKSTIKLQPTGSLTETVMNVVYTVVPVRGAVVIL